MHSHYLSVFTALRRYAESGATARLLPPAVSATLAVPQRRRRFYQKNRTLLNMFVLNNQGVRTASDQLTACAVQQYGQGRRVTKSSE